MTRRQIAKGFVAELQSKSMAVAVKELAAFVITDKRVNDLDLLLEEIRRELQRVAGHVSAEVITAHPLSAKLKEEITKLLKTKTSAVTIDISNTVDESVKGGFIARTAEFEFDASVAGKLAQLKGATR